jgi:hypothetical protein
LSKEAKINNYLLSEQYPFARYTAGVLREDIETTLRGSGFKTLDVPPASTNWLGRISSYSRASALLRKQLSHPACVFFHFPLRSRMNRYLLSHVKRHAAKAIAYVHDFEGLRDQDRELLQKELIQLQQFDVIIAQNSVMKAFIQKETGINNVIELEMYDYLGVPESAVQPVKHNDIIFAGNLVKAPFITQLERLAPLRFTVFGEPVPQSAAANILYKGNEDPRTLPAKLAKDGSYGLVWDGSSIETGKQTGTYLRINMPHKLALYIMAGLPVIVWKESAMAGWVEEKRIGIAVNSLTELKQRLDNISEDQYNEFRENMQPIRAKMAEGFYLTKAISTAEKMLA